MVTTNFSKLVMVLGYFIKVIVRFAIKTEVTHVIAVSVSTLSLVLLLFIKLNYHSLYGRLG